MEDITKTGPVGLKGLKGINQQSDPNTEYFNNLMRLSGKQIRQTYTPEVSQDIGLRLGEAGYGQSSYDDAIQNLSQLDNIDDVRAEQQPWYAKWGAGLGKGVALAGTTFLNGTVGLMYGLASAIWNQDAARIWDNQVSNTLEDWNKELEVLLPNYRSQEEQERPWYKNLGTANFWADSFLKNLGFTVGAFYSGGVWTKGLKAIGWIKGAMAAKGTGSLLSAINEGRIEANQGAGDWKELEYEKLRDKYEELYNYIDSQPDALVLNPETGVAENSKQKRLAELQDNLRAEQASIDERAKKMGLTTLIGNTVLLSLDNLNTFGKLYTRGFKNSRTISNGARGSFREGLRKAGIELAEEEAGVGIRKEAGKYVFDKVSNKRALGRGLKTGLIEGNEELAQDFISETAGNMQTYDSPDAYYLALTDRNAELKTKDFMTSAIEGFADTYGNGDRYEKFAVGALTGIIGTPTFGRVNNSDHNTYLGRGKMVGLSGGLFGEFSNAKYQNAQGEDAVQGMNEFVDKLKTQQGYFVQSQSFTNAMDGWSEENDAFEFKNAEDNNDFAAISRFAKAGRLSDLREMVNQDFEGISDEQLADIATNTTSQFGGWRSTDGTLMSDTQEGRDLMRNELSLKRDKILSEIDRYEKSVEAVRAIGNNSLTDDQVNELAWLNWKVGKFDERFTSIKQENEPLFTSLRSGLEEFRNSIDEDSEEGKKWLNTVNIFNQFLNHLSGSKSSLDMASRLAANPKLTQALTSQDFFDFFADKSGLSFEDYSTAMDNLVDAARLATASKTFNERYKEFKENPIELIKNRQKIDKSKEKVNTASENVSSMDRVRNSSVSDLASAMRDGSFDADAFDSILEGLEGEDVEEQKKKVQEAQAINSGSEQLSQAINAAELEGIDPLEMEAVKRDAQALLDKATESAESLDDLFNTNTEAWLDPRNLPVGEDESINLEEAQERLDAARSLVQQQLAQVKDAAEVMAQVPKSGQPQAAPETGATGHDPVDRTITENERKKKEEEAAAKREAKLDRTAAYNAGVEKLTSNMPDAVKSRYQQLATQLLTDLNMLLNKGLSNEEIVSVLSASTTHKDLNAANPFINNLLNDYINAYRSEVTQPKPTAPQPAPRITTPVIEAGNTMAVQPPSADMGSSKVGGMYMFLRPSTTELPIHYNGGATTPYHELVKDSGQYTASELQRMKAVYEYLENHGAFQRVNEGRIKPGDTVGFMIDPTLNEKAGDTVILITDKDGKVIGDLPARGSRTFGEYAGLAELVDRIEKEYKETGKITATTQVDKNFVGKVPTVDTYSTLNAISEGKGFTLGIALEGGNMPSIIIEGGRTKKTRGDRDNQAIRPANAAAGQPFLMLETSSPTRHYYPVPILMKSFGKSTQGTQLHKAVEDAVSSILNKASRPTEVKDDLLDVLALEAAYVQYNGDKVKLRVKKPGQGWEDVFEGVPTPETISEVLKRLEGTPYQVSRKYINGEYKGQSYNDMIGEIAEANLPIGTRHTVSDWFSLKLTNGQKTVSPRTRGENPHRAASVFVTVNYKGKPLTVDTKSWEVSDSTGTVYNGERADKVKAYAWGLHTNQDMTKPYVSKWGKFDPVKGDFVKSNPVAAPVDDSLLAGFAEAQADFESFIASREAETPPVQGHQPTTPNVSNYTTGTYSDRYNALIQDGVIDKEWALINGREAVIANINGIKVPFYKSSSGTDGKTKGNWYPFFGVGAGSRTNKGETTSKNAIGIGDIIEIYTSEGEKQEDSVYRVDNKTETKRGTNLNLTNVVKKTRVTLREQDVLDKLGSKYKKISPSADGNWLIKGDIQEMENGYGIPEIQRIQGILNTAFDWTPSDMITRGKDNKVGHAIFEVSPIDGKEINSIILGRTDSGVQNGVNAQSHIESFLSQFKTQPQTPSGPTASPTPLRDEVVKKYGAEFEGGGSSLFSLYPGFDKKLLTKFENFYSGDGEFTEQDAKDFLAEVERNEAIRLKERDKKDAPYLDAIRNATTEQEAEKALYAALGIGIDAKIVTPIYMAKRHELASKNAPNPEVAELSADEAKAKVANAGLLNTPIRQSAWDRMSVEAQRMIAAKAGRPKATQWMDALGKVFDPKTGTFDLNKLAGKPKSIEEYLSSKPKFERVDRTDREWNEARERQWLEQALPQLSTDDRLRVHKGLIRISEKDGGGEAYGQFWNGVITIASNAAQGTLYHEAFHAVVDTLLDNQEHELLFQAAEEKWGNIGILALEEKMADDFRKYVQLEETPILGKAIKAYRTLKHIVQNLFGKEPFINKVYYNISRGKYAGRTLNDSSNSDVKYMMAEGFRGTIEEFQSIVDSNVNNSMLHRTRKSMANRWGELLDFWRSEGYEVKGYFKNGKWNVASATTVTKYRRVTVDDVSQYHRDKLAYGNLEASDRQYLEDRGISREDYNNMSQKEKEVLFHCR